MKNGQAHLKLLLLCIVDLSSAAVHYIKPLQHRDLKPRSVALCNKKLQVLGSHNFATVKQARQSARGSLQ
jgi:hypothetical protein